MFGVGYWMLDVGCGKGSFQSVVSWPKLTASEPETGLISQAGSLAAGVLKLPH
jgi:hypothetical protein